jgi:hypothetical protein
MPSSNLTHASSRANTRPPCPKCGTTMVLARIAPQAAEQLQGLIRAGYVYRNGDVHILTARCDATGA